MLRSSIFMTFTLSSVLYSLTSSIGYWNTFFALWEALMVPLLHFGPGGTFGLGGPCSSVLPLGSWAPCGPCAPVSPLEPYWPVSPLGPCEPVPSLGPWAPVSPFRAGPPVILPHLCDPVPLYNLLVLDVPLGLYHLWLLVPPCVPCGPSGPQGPTRWALWPCGTWWNSKFHQSCCWCTPLYNFFETFFLVSCGFSW